MTTAATLSTSSNDTGAHPEAVEPSVFVIFGATGDLARRKVIPALWQLHAHGLTAGGCLILGVARAGIADDAAFRDIVREAIPPEAGSPADVAAWGNQWVYYQPTLTGDPTEF